MMPGFGSILYLRFLDSVSLTSKVYTDIPESEPSRPRHFGYRIFNLQQAACLSTSPAGHFPSVPGAQEQLKHDDSVTAD